MDLFNVCGRILRWKSRSVYQSNIITTSTKDELEHCIILFYSDSLLPIRIVVRLFLRLYPEGLMAALSELFLMIRWML